MLKPLTVASLLALACSACVASHETGPVAVTLHGQQFTAELATDEAAREHGLMMRTALAANHGMLFVFPDTAPRGFWMKNTLIPLDILYFDAERKLVSAQLDVPPCKVDPCPIYPSTGPARYVLELSAGTVKRLGVRDGDMLAIRGDVGPVD
ncbi:MULTISPECIES: DUF192 domain-containing protein [Rhodanobacter]|uniref:DUF192 domain-containing protein n=1 Tax=Rhodanobacter hydrolyticus TaxID=2250595 RepID=A0ABW8JAJ1_9GAMM|nr:DUF192 domain-containing protein [Rhodanobacter sp. 7MK24]MBD8881235.1 DUF192 domain-containing protein [Rhodanobacter sp. 7MK24]